MFHVCASEDKNTAKAEIKDHKMEIKRRLLSYSTIPHLAMGNTPTELFLEDQSRLDFQGRLNI